MPRSIYRVVPNNSKWELRGPENDNQAFERQEDAVNAGREAARNNEPSQLVVHEADGTIGYENTHGDDPERSRG